jgi:hypothetical protein
MGTEIRLMLAMASYVRGTTGRWSGRFLDMIETGSLIVLLVLLPSMRNPLGL